MLSDVIAALATPAGRSAVALIRVSGRGAHDVTARVLAPFQARPARIARRAQARHPGTGAVLDEVLYTAFTAPGSYTGEDLVEIGTHGGVLVPAEVLAALHVAGARPAHPGEFTRRALRHGKLDLLQAEATADLIEATAPAQRRAALHQLDRGLSARITRLRERVLELEALVSYDIDFPEEDDGPVPAARVTQAAADVLARLDALLRTASDGARLRDGALCVIAGVPNTGKSSLFNALLGTERAIVTEVAGTTRDAIEAPATCGGFPFRLVDTAGLRESDDRIERLGVEVSRRYLAGADLVLFCVEAGRPLHPVEATFLADISVPKQVVRTKADLHGGTAGTDDAPAVSTVTGVGLDVVRAALARLAFGGLAGDAGLEPALTRARHQAAVQRARDEVACFANTRGAGVDAVVAATHLRAAVSALEDVIGVVTPDDVLDRVFATFCVGK